MGAVTVPPVRLLFMTRLAESATGRTSPICMFCKLRSKLTFCPALVTPTRFQVCRVLPSGCTTLQIRVAERHISGHRDLELGIDTTQAVQHHGQPDFYPGGGNQTDIWRIAQQS